MKKCQAVLSLTHSRMMMIKNVTFLLLSTFFVSSVLNAPLEDFTYATGTELSDFNEEDGRGFGGHRHHRGGNRRYFNENLNKNNVNVVKLPRKIAPLPVPLPLPPVTLPPVTLPAMTMTENIYVTETSVLPITRTLTQTCYSTVTQLLTTTETQVQVMPTTETQIQTSMIFQTITETSTDTQLLTVTCTTTQTQLNTVTETQLNTMTETQTMPCPSVLPSAESNLNCSPPTGSTVAPEGQSQAPVTTYN